MIDIQHPFQTMMWTAGIAAVCAVLIHIPIFLRIVIIWIRIVQTFFHMLMLFSLQSSPSQKSTAKPKPAPKQNVTANTATKQTNGIFSKELFHGTKSLATAKEILNTNTWWVNSGSAINGIHFGHRSLAECYGSYLIKVKVTCRQDDIMDYGKPNSRKAKLVRCDDDGITCHYFIPVSGIQKGKRYRPAIVTPLEIIKKN